MFTHRKQVATIAGHENLDPCFYRAGEDQIVVSVAADRLWPARGGGDQFHREVDEQLLDRLPTVGLEAELPGQDALQLDQHGPGQDELDAGVDRLLEDPARRASGDERRDEDVGVAGDAQDQRRPERNSSTTTSLSSGPMPMASARPRP
jgi:hypothetical protein